MTGKVFSAALLAVCLGAATMSQVPDQPDAQAAPARAAAQPPTITIPLSAGTAINASLTTALDSTHSKPGDSVSAMVTESVMYQRSVLLPKGSRIAGHVVRTGADAEQGSAIYVVFDRAILPNGQQAGLNAGIQALAPPTAHATIPSRKEYEEDWIAGNVPSGTATPKVVEPTGTMVVPSTFTTPRKAVTSELPESVVEGGLDHQGRFTTDSKGAFDDPSMRVFTPVSEGSHGTVLLGAKKNIHLDSGTHLLIVIQPPASSASAQ